MKKTNFLGLVAGVLFLLPTIAFSQVAEQLLARDLAAGVKPFGKTVKVFSYFRIQENYQQLESVSGRNEFINSHLQYTTGNFWDMDFQRTDFVNAGPGLYLAIDPHISLSFGNTMVELTIPGDFLKINVVKPIPVQKDTLNALAAENIVSNQQAKKLFGIGSAKVGFYRDTLKYMIQPENHAFRRLIQKLFTDKNIQFVEYNWDSSLGGFCTKNTTSAFVYIGRPDPSTEKKGIIDEAFLDSPMLSTWNFQNLTSRENEMTARVSKIRDALTEVVTLRKQGVKLKPAMILKYYTMDEFAQIKNSLYSCQ